MSRLDAALAYNHNVQVIEKDTELKKIQDEIVRLEAAMAKLDNKKQDINDKITELQHSKRKYLTLGHVNDDVTATKYLDKTNTDITKMREEIKDIEEAKVLAANQLEIERQRYTKLHQSIDYDKFTNLNEERLELYKEYDKVLDSVADYFVRFVEINKRLGDLDQSASGKTDADYYKYHNDDTHIAILVRKLTPYLLQLQTFNKHETALKDGTFHGSARAKEITKYMNEHNVNHDTALINLATTVWNDKLKPQPITIPQPAERVI